MAISRVGYVAVPAAPKKLVQLREVICGRFSVQLLLEMVNYEGPAVVLLCLLSFVERLKEFWIVRNGMGVPLPCSLGEKRVSKEILVFATGGGASVRFLPGGRAARIVSLHQTRKYDATKGYPGEDISPN